MKKQYEKPQLIKRDRLASVAATIFLTLVGPID
jgi:hypothetical protein